MTAENWHSDFNPAKFLDRVNLAKLIERNKAYNDSSVSNAKSPCILCEKIFSQGILLNDKSFLCQSCYSDVSLTSYPEKYEELYRKFIKAKEARRLAWEGFREKFEHKSTFFLLGLLSLLLIFAHPYFLVLTVGLFIVNHYRKIMWLKRKTQWESINLVPQEPTLKHFHDPAANLTQRDIKILKIFNHWPGYPPFWKYLRAVVLQRDSNRCQVTGCPSQLELHIHHMHPVADGGTHSPDNLVSLCNFHHALEPAEGHEKIWADIKAKHFTLVRSHAKNNRLNVGTHTVRAHLRRLQLISLEELYELKHIYGLCCPDCANTRITFILDNDKNTISVKCPACQKEIKGPQQLTEETGPRLAELLKVTVNKGRWKARWDMLEERKNNMWGVWDRSVVLEKRKSHKEKIETTKSAPKCPRCGSPMKVVRPRPADIWQAFWGCTQYPRTKCKGSAEYLLDN